MEKGRFNLSEWLQEGFRTYRENIFTLIPAALIAVVLSVFTAGVLAGPMLSGLLLLTLSLLRRQRPKPEILDIFKGFRFFLNAAIFVLGWGIAIFVGCMILMMVPGIGPLAVLFFVYSAQAFLMFGPFLIVDRGVDFRSATIIGFKAVQSDFWFLLSVSAVAGVIGSIGLFAFGIGVIVTFPLQLCILAAAYEGVFENDPEKKSSLGAFFDHGDKTDGQDGS